MSTAFKILLIVVSITITSFVLSWYATLLQHFITVRYNGYFELGMIIGMVLFQYPFILKNTSIVKLNYYFNMMLVSFTGSILLLPLLLLNSFNHLTDTINIAYFLLVVAIMFFDHARRVRLLKLPVFLSYTWILYRFIILLFIL